MSLKDPHACLHEHIMAMIPPKCRNCGCYMDTDGTAIIPRKVTFPMPGGPYRPKPKPDPVYTHVANGGMMQVAICGARESDGKSIVAEMRRANCPVCLDLLRMRKRKQWAKKLTPPQAKAWLYMLKCQDQGSPATVRAVTRAMGAGHKSIAWGHHTMQELEKLGYAYRFVGPGRIRPMWLAKEPK